MQASFFIWRPTYWHIMLHSICLLGLLLIDGLTGNTFIQGFFSPIILLLSAVTSQRLGRLNWLVGFASVLLAFHFFLPITSPQPLFNYALAFGSLIASYGIGRHGIKLALQQQQREQDLILATQLAHLGNWQISSNANISLSQQAQEILHYSHQTKVSLERFFSLFIAADRVKLHDFFEYPTPQNQDQAFRLITDDGLKWIRFYRYDHPNNHLACHGIVQDMYINQSPEKVLDHAHHPFNTMSDSLHLFSWIAQPDGSVSYLSQYVSSFVGESAEIFKEHWPNFLHPDDVQLTLDHWSHAVQTGETYATECRIRRKDGEYIWFLLRAVPIHSAQGEILKWYGSAIDISESKLFQQRSERLSLQLQTIIDSITDAFFSLDLTLCFNYINDQAATLLGQHDASSLNGQRFEDYPLQNEKLSHHFERALLTQSVVNLDFWYETQQCWLDICIYPSSVGLTVYLRDVTQQRQAQQELILMRTAVAQLNDIVIITEASLIDEPNPKIVFVNEAFERITGYQRAEVLGRSPRFLQGPKTDRVALNRIHNALSHRQPHRTPLINYHKNGHEIHVEFSVMPISVTGDKYTHFVSIQRDVSAQITLQHQLQLSQRLEALGQLTGGIAHDFNNLLTIITGNTELLADQLPSSSKLRSLTQLITAAVDRGAALTSNLLAFARKQPLSPEAVDINHIVMQIQALFKSSLGGNIQLKIDLEPDLWPVLIDPVQFESSLLNLMINARDAMPNGGQLSVKTSKLPYDDGLIVEPSHQQTDYVSIDVRDSGVGIAEHLLDKIFEPFFTTKPTGKGSGLGLSMVFGFIKQSGGHILVESDADSGTCFKILLPRTQTVMAQASEVNNIVSYPRLETDNQKTILIVEDDDLVRHYAANQLRSAGYQILIAESGEKAMEWIRSSHPIDLLFTDLLMPDGMDGRELSKQATICRPNLPVLYTSGYSENALSDLTPQQRQNTVLHKPYQRTAMLSKVSLALSAAQINKVNNE